MRNPKRVLAAVAGASLAAALGTAGPALAADQGTKQATHQVNQTTSVSMEAAGWDDDYVVGYYSTQSLCDRAGSYGVRAGAWGNFHSYQVQHPSYGMVWVLGVAGDDWKWDGWDGGWPSGWPHRPNYLVLSEYSIGGAYQHPFRHYSGIRYGSLGYHKNWIPRFPGWPGHGGGGWHGGWHGGGGGWHGGGGHGGGWHGGGGGWHGGGGHGGGGGGGQGGGHGGGGGQGGGQGGGGGGGEGYRGMA